MSRTAVLFVGLLAGCGSVPLRFGPTGPDGGAPPAALRCDPEGHCVECLSSSDCGGVTPVCDPSLRRCVPCAGAMGCAAGSVCTHSTCVVTCVEASTCGGAPAGCVDGVCAACADDEDCTTGVCDHESGRCVSCRSDGDCGGGPTPRCQPWTGTCVACVTESDCGGGRGCLAGACVAR